MKNWPKFKLGQVGIDWKVDQSWNYVKLSRYSEMLSRYSEMLSHYSEILSRYSDLVSQL